MKRNFRGLGIYVFIFLIIVFVWRAFGSNGLNTNTCTMTEFQQELDSDQVKSIVIRQNEEVPTGNLTIVLNDGSREQMSVSDVKEIESMLKKANFEDYTLKDVPGENVWIQLLPTLLMAGVLIFFIMSMSAQSGGGSNSKMMNFGKSRAKMTMGENVNVKFSDVAGLSEEKEELEGMVDFLKDPAKYTKLGARIPKGVILVGPPGTGKTLIAKAVAGEAGVPFFSISGSDFVEMFVGVGASRVRDMFAEAKRHAPCIVFIDEIDAVGRRRGTGMGGGHDEREQTLNQMLVEMDGFGVNEGIIVIAATNRVDILDPALLRPGRFDRKVYVGRPDVGGREQILNVHAKNKPLADDVDLKQIAQTTAGFTGADLENLLNEAAIIAAKDNRMYICQNDIKRAFIKVGIGAEKKSRVISEKEKRITAFHEAGHAILFHLLPDVGPVYTVSIIPTGAGAAGYTMPLIFEDVTTGASQDIKQATAMAKAMVTKYGMSDDVGMICYDDDEEVFIGRDLGHTRGYSENVAARIDSEVKRILDECSNKARQMIRENEDVLYRCAELLLEKEKIGRSEFEALFEAKADDVITVDGKEVETSAE